MTELLGGQEAWDKIAQAFSPRLRALGVTEEEIRHLTPTEENVAKMAALFITARPGVQSKPAIVLPTEVRALISDWFNPDPIEHVPSTDFPVEEIEFISYLSPGESSVDSKTMRDSAVTLQGNLGLADAPRILAYLNKTKPKELQGYFIVLPGTVLSDSNGRLHVPCLGWDGGQWILSFSWLDSRWDGYGRIARRK